MQIMRILWITIRNQLKECFHKLKFLSSLLINKSARLTQTQIANPFYLLFDANNADQKEILLKIRVIRVIRVKKDIRVAAILALAGHSYFAYGIANLHDIEATRQLPSVQPRG